MKGRVKNFNADKGYGFIVCDGIKNDIFVHFTQIVSDESFKKLSQGDVVEFDAKNVNGRYQAHNVRVI